jgi:hypothetical protein
MRATLFTNELLQLGREAQFQDVGMLAIGAGSNDELRYVPATAVGNA